MTEAQPPAEKQPEKQPPAPIIPWVQELQPQGRSALPAEVSQAIANVDPNRALEYVDNWVRLDYQEREQNRLQEYQDRDKEREHQLRLAQTNMELEKIKESNRAQEQTAARSSSQKIIFWSVGTFVALFVSALGFSYVAEDKEFKIPLTLLATGTGLVGGTGVTGLIKGRSSGNGEADKKK